MKTKISKYIFLLTMIFCMNGVLKAETPTWKFSGTMPIGLWGSEAVVMDSLIYVLGGYSDSLQKVVDWVYKFSPKTNTWNLVGKMKRPRRNFAAVKMGNKIYYSGGEVYNTTTTGGPIEVFDCTNNTSSIIDSNKKFNRINISGTIIDSVYYFVGGSLYNSGGGYKPYVIGYNLRTKVFTNNTNPVFSHEFPEYQAVLGIGNNAFIFGGVFFSVRRDVFRFNTKNKMVYSIFTDLARPTAGCELIYFPDSNKIMMIGGFNEGTTTLNNVDMYTIKDSMNLQSTSVSPILQRRRDFMVALVEDQVYVFGGRNSNDQTLRSIERYEKTSDIEDEESLPTGFALKQNYPNPFNPSTTIVYNIPEHGSVEIKVYDLMGNECYNYKENNVSIGEGRIVFNGSHLTSGVYFYNMKFIGERKSFSETKKMMLIK